MTEVDAPRIAALDLMRDDRAVADRPPSTSVKFGKEIDMPFDRMTWEDQWLGGF